MGIIGYNFWQPLMENSFIYFIAIGFFFSLGLYFQKINNTLSTIFVFWLIHQAVIPFSNLFHKLEDILNYADNYFKIINYFIPHFFNDYQ